MLIDTMNLLYIDINSCCHVIFVHSQIQLDISTEVELTIIVTRRIIILS